MEGRCETFKIFLDISGKLDIHRQPMREDRAVKAPVCPFQVECQFYNSPTKTPSDELLGRLFCNGRYDTCEIAKRLLLGKSVPKWACPDGNIKGQDLG
jgi:hypothetical protein